MSDYEVPWVALVVSALFGLLAFMSIKVTANNVVRLNCMAKIN
jgi:amino acid permease